MKNPKTVEKPSDLQERVDNFNQEVIPLLTKYKLGLGAQAFITGEGQVAARPTIVDATEMMKSEINEG